MTSNDELERQKFDKWFEKEWLSNIRGFPAREQRRIQQMGWLAWQARAKQESNHD